MSQNNRRRQKL